MKELSMWIVLAVSSTLLGCAASSFTPTPISMGHHDLTVIKSGEPIAVIKKQEITLAELQHSDYGTVKVDLNSWCDQAMSLIKEWLDYNRIPIDQNAAKKLYVSVLNPRGRERGSLTFDLRVETGSGLVKTFPTECTAGRPSRAIGYAINWGVVKAIHDPEILAYMDQGRPR